jgi:hypothetical protein
LMSIGVGLIEPCFVFAQRARARDLTSTSRLLEARRRDGVDLRQRNRDQKISATFRKFRNSVWASQARRNVVMPLSFSQPCHAITPCQAACTAS